jgi:hypothetical protein
MAWRIEAPPVRPRVASHVALLQFAAPAGISTSRISAIRKQLRIACMRYAESNKGNQGAMLNNTKVGRHDQEWSDRSSESEFGRESVSAASASSSTTGPSTATRRK